MSIGWCCAGARYDHIVTRDCECDTHTHRILFIVCVCHQSVPLWTNSKMSRKINRLKTFTHDFDVVSKCDRWNWCVGEQGEFVNTIFNGIALMRERFRAFATTSNRRNSISVLTSPSKAIRFVSSLAMVGVTHTHLLHVHVSIGSATSVAIAWLKTFALTADSQHPFIILLFNKRSFIAIELWRPGWRDWRNPIDVHFVKLSIKTLEIARANERQPNKHTSNMYRLFVCRVVVSHLTAIASRDIGVMHDEWRRRRRMMRSSSFMFRWDICQFLAWSIYCSIVFVCARLSIAHRTHFVNRQMKWRKRIRHEKSMNPLPRHALNLAWLMPFNFLTCCLFVIHTFFMSLFPVQYHCMPCASVCARRMFR